MRSSPAVPTQHPLAPLTGDEITAAREIVFASGRPEVPDEVLRFADLSLDPGTRDVRRGSRRIEHLGRRMMGRSWRR